MTDVIQFIEKFRIGGGTIWLEGDTIKLSTSKELQNLEIKEFILNNRDRVICVLRENSIFTRRDFFRKKILKKSIDTHYPLSPAQERLWFIEQYEGGTNAYHIPTVFELSSGTDVTGIKYALGKIVTRHEVLRSTIEFAEDQQGIQVVHDEPLPIEEVVLTEKDDYEGFIREDINQPFDLSSEYP